MYDFNQIINRRNTTSVKWDVAENELPMWVADMDFQVAPEIKEVMIKEAEHGVYGYTFISDEWYKAYQNWWQRRHDFSIEKEWLSFVSGVLPAISSVIRKLTTPAENVIIQTPVYHMFFNCVLNNGRKVLENPLKFENGEFSIDFCDLEKKMADPQTTLMLFCNPHNPVGKIWDKETIIKIGKLAKKHGVIVLSDEIHCDLTDPNKSYIPFASASEECKENSITTVSPSKAFNLAGIRSAAIFTPNNFLRNKVNRAINTDEVAEANYFATESAIAAFNLGEQWLDELREYLYENKNTVAEFVEKELPKVKLIASEATYLLWLDLSKYKKSTDVICDFIRKKTGLFLSNGVPFGGSGEYFARINIGCPNSVLIDGLNRLKDGLDAFEREQ